MPSDLKLESADQVCDRLKVSKQTLYAYVSRGLLRTSRHNKDSRRRLYYSVDVDQLVVRQNLGRSRRDVARSTVDFGEPVLTSKISNIENGEFFYRGKNAIELSKTASLEDVFQLLCKAPNISKKTPSKTHYVSTKAKPFERFVDALANQVSHDSSLGNKRTAYNLLSLMVSNAAQKNDEIGNQPIHQRLADAWSKDPNAADIIRRALVLCADHELNASTYACRITASAGANLSACLLTGISTLSGNSHGRLTDLCAQWMFDASKNTISDIELASDQFPPGFGHRLYPNGDPRAIELLKVCPAPKKWQSIVKKIKRSNSLAQPTLDFGLATIEHQLNFPKGAGFSIFAVGRTVGWLAHCFEQRQTGSLIRPRASY